MPDARDLAADLARLDEQHRRVRFTAFDETDAWALGSMLRDRAAVEGAAVTIEIRLHGHTVFMHAMAGTSPANADWARRKRTVVELVHRSSYWVGRDDAHAGRSTPALMGLSERDAATHGGGVPIVVEGMGCVGVATVSGLPQRRDHEMVIEAMCAMTGVPYDEVRLA